MSNKSILLALTAAEESVYAAELAWELAKVCGATVLAQHVVDSRHIDMQLDLDRPGFLHQELRAQAHQAILDTMHFLGTDLITSYQARAADKRMATSCVLEHGNPVHETCRRALEHDLVIVGHRPTVLSAPEDLLRFGHGFSLAESLAHKCPRPLLVVLKKVNSWTHLRIGTSMVHVNIPYVNACLEIASALSIRPSLMCLGSGLHEESAESFMRDLRAVDPILSNLPIEIRNIDAEISEESASYWSNTESELQSGISPGSLVVIPTREIARRRITIFGNSPASFIRDLDLSSIMLWPEEYVGGSKQQLTGEKRIPA